MCVCVFNLHTLTSAVFSANRGRKPQFLKQRRGVAEAVKAVRLWITAAPDYIPAV